MKRIEYIDKINSCLARFVAEVEGFNAINQYHINIHAEHFLIPVFNEIFELKLENLNSTQRANYPAIDLADFNKRIAFQITATNSVDKIKSTLKTFFEKHFSNQFDFLYIYILTQKRDNYAKVDLSDLIPKGFNFKTSDHVLDKDDLLRRINAINSTPKLELLTRLFEHEFSDAQIETRSQEFKSGLLSTEPETLFPNYLEISFPKSFYKADLAIDESALTQQINDYLVSIGKKPVKKIRKMKLIRRALRNAGTTCNDWLFQDGAILSFKDLSNGSEPLRRIVDAGTVNELSCEEYFEIDENTAKNFKNLLRNTLMELCFKRGIQWFGGKKVFRFVNDSHNPDEKKIKWKAKRESTKTVIFKMINKKEGHIICFRNLAFRATFETFDDKWYLVINPTWSFTNPFGYKTSRFEPSYMSGIKRLENNASVCYYFRFFSFYLSFSDLFSENYPYLQIHLAQRLAFCPSLKETTWRPAKVQGKVPVGEDAELNVDSELDLTLFD